VLAGQEVYRKWAIRSPEKIIASKRDNFKLTALPIQIVIRDAADNRDVEQTAEGIFLCIKHPKVRVVTMGALQKKV